MSPSKQRTYLIHTLCPLPGPEWVSSRFLLLRFSADGSCIPLHSPCKEKGYLPAPWGNPGGGWGIPSLFDLQAALKAFKTRRAVQTNLPSSNCRQENWCFERKNSSSKQGYYSSMFEARGSSHASEKDIEFADGTQIQPLSWQYSIRENVGQTCRYYCEGKDTGPAPGDDALRTGTGDVLGAERG